MKKNKNIKIIIGIVIGVVLSAVTSYAIAKTLIDSKDVIYTDKSELNAGNVQDAIDGTCSKIDTRLSEIEDKLYTVKKISGTKRFNSSKTLSYTGVSIELPAKSYCSIDVTGSWTIGYPTSLVLTSSIDNYLSSRLASNSIGMVDTYTTGPDALNWSISASYSTYTENKMTIYVFAKWDNVGDNGILWDGFCATKYK